MDLNNSSGRNKGVLVADYRSTRPLSTFSLLSHAIQVPNLHDLCVDLSYCWYWGPILMTKKVEEAELGGYLHEKATSINEVIVLVSKVC